MRRLIRVLDWQAVKAVLELPVFGALVLFPMLTTVVHFGLDYVLEHLQPGLAGLATGTGPLLLHFYGLLSIICAKIVYKVRCPNEISEFVSVAAYIEQMRPQINLTTRTRIFNALTTRGLLGATQFAPATIPVEELLRLDHSQHRHANRIACSIAGLLSVIGLTLCAAPVLLRIWRITEALYNEFVGVPSAGV